MRESYRIQSNAAQTLGTVGRLQLHPLRRRYQPRRPAGELWEPSVRLDAGRCRCACTWTPPHQARGSAQTPLRCGMVGSCAACFSSFVLFTLSNLIPCARTASGILLQVVITIVVQGTLLALVTLSSAPMPVYIVQHFRSEIRYTAVAIAYNVAQAVFGGTTPLVATALMSATGSECSNPSDVSQINTPSSAACSVCASKWCGSF